MSESSTPLVPRNGHTLVVGIVARISGCANQKEVSLEDQVDHGKQVVGELYDGPVEYRKIATKGKGERLDRPELAEIEAMLRSRELDLLVAEDIGRMVRGTEAAHLCGIAVDHGTRVLAANDCIDTADATWEEDVISACRDHVGHNAHTSKRLKQKLMNRFVKVGAATPREIFGYTKPPGAKTYADWQKDPAATPIYQEWFERLRRKPNCSAVADWLNAKQVTTGKYCRRKTWDGKMVRRMTRNPLLKGMPGRGFRFTTKHHESGRRISVPNPKGPKFREQPELAHVEPDLWEEVNALLVKRNEGFGRKPVNGVDPRCRVPRKRTRFPGQHARCWYCGRQFVWGGNGVTENLMCTGAREGHCWNSLGFNGALAGRLLLEAIMAELYQLDGFDDQFRHLIEQFNQKGGADLTQQWDELRRRQETLDIKKGNLLEAIKAYGPKPMLQQGLAELEAEEHQLRAARRELEGRDQRTPQLPESIGELHRLLEDKFEGLAQDSAEFGDLLRQLAPEFFVYLVRLCDGGHLLPRARVTISLSAIIPDMRHAPEIEQVLACERTLNLFEPPQRERIRTEAVRFTAEGLEQREIARRLPETATQTAVYRALALDRMMGEQHLDTPYLLVTQPPSDYSKLRRHKNEKYRFEAVAGYQQPVI